MVAASPSASCSPHRARWSSISAGHELLRPTIPGHPNVFVVGDMVLSTASGMAQGAIQGFRYATDAIKAESSASWSAETVQPLLG